jgi:hypothetical protein
VYSLLIAAAIENMSKKIKIHLPESILSQIFSKLGSKDLVKTSALSKLWRHEWQLRTVPKNANIHFVPSYLKLGSFGQRISILISVTCLILIKFNNYQEPFHSFMDFNLNFSQG